MTSDVQTYNYSSFILLLAFWRKLPAWSKFGSFKFDPLWVCFLCQRVYRSVRMKEGSELRVEISTQKFTKYALFIELQVMRR